MSKFKTYISALTKMTGEKMRARGVRRSLTVVLLSLAIALSIVFTIIGAQGARGWGWGTHRFIANEAVDVFSDNSFFSAHRTTISNYSVKPDEWKSSDPLEQYRHWYHVDVPDGENEYYRGGLPNNWSLLDQGVLPWAVEDNFASIVRSLEDGAWERAAQLMGAVSHYTEDATNPLHATSDYSPGGEHGGYEGEVNHHLNEISVPDYVPQELENIFEATMAVLEGSFDFTDEDPKGGIDLCFFLEDHILWNEIIQEITEDRVRASVQFTANLWYTAMIQAGLTIQAPTLLEPGDGDSITTSTPAFTWAPIDGTSFYDFQLASDEGFTSDVITVKDLSTTSYTLENLLVNDNWYWRVRSGDDSTHVGLWSQTWQFSVTAEGGGMPMTLVAIAVVVVVVLVVVAALLRSRGRRAAGAARAEQREPDAEQGKPQTT